MNWQINIQARTTAPDGSSRRINGYTDGAGDIIGATERYLLRWIRKPSLWYGVEVTIITPLGQVAYRVIEAVPTAKLRLTREGATQENLI